MKKGFQAVTALLFSAFFFAGCSKPDTPEPDRCGAELNQKVSMNKDFHFVFNETEWTEGNIFVQEDGHRRIFTLKQAGTGVCPDELVTLLYTVRTGTVVQSTVPVKIEGKGIWGDGGKKTITLAGESQGNMKRDFLYEGDLSADLKPAFGTNAGSIQSVLSISYYSLGNIGLDTAYFKAMFKEVSLNMSCKSYKN